MVLQALATVFSFEGISAIVIGTIFGMIMGALPGLSATMGVAMLTPVTYAMSPMAGISMLAAVYTSAIYGGSITATLLHTPGTPASAATAIDGYELTKQGKGMKAVGIATISSMIGGTFSAIMLLLIAPPLAKVALSFAPPEYMLVALFGLTIIGSLAGDNMIKGLMSASVGLIISCIGIDKMSFVPRYTFGKIVLEGGIDLVPAMIGMFSISQVMMICEDIHRGRVTIMDDPKEALKGKILPTKEEFKRMIPVMLQSNIIGLLIGILPAAGGDIGSWVSYNSAKKTSKHPEEFGHGSIEGICASETANNAVTGGALIPLLTLGIPGSGTTAIMLGSLMIHGLQPGYDLFKTSGKITYGIMFAFLIANILMGVIGLLSAKGVARVATVPMSILCGIIIALGTVGAYSYAHRMFDVYMMLLFGLIGYFVRKIDMGVAPMMLGVILCPMVEANFRRCLVLCRGDLLGYFFGRPISVVLLIFLVFAVFSPFIMKRVTTKMRSQN